MARTPAIWTIRNCGIKSLFLLLSDTDLPDFFLISVQLQVSAAQILTSGNFRMAKAASRGKIANKINSKKNKGKTSQSTLQKAQKQKIGAKNVAPLNRGALQKKTKAGWWSLFTDGWFLQWKCFFLDYESHFIEL